MGGRSTRANEGDGDGWSRHQGWLKQTSEILTSPCQLWAHLHQWQAVPGVLTAPFSGLASLCYSNQGSPVSWGLSQPKAGKPRSARDFTPQGHLSTREGRQWRGKHPASPFRDKSEACHTHFLRGSSAGLSPQWDPLSDLVLGLFSLLPLSPPDCASLGHLPHKASPLLEEPKLIQPWPLQRSSSSGMDRVEDLSDTHGGWTVIGRKRDMGGSAQPKLISNEMVVLPLT